MSFDPHDYDGITTESELRDARQAEERREDEAAELRAREYAFEETPACEASGCFTTPDFTHTMRCQMAVAPVLTAALDAWLASQRAARLDGAIDLWIRNEQEAA